MSSYLLLRDNKESGPHSMEEIQAMGLKSYDLIWVVGKSAAWRYPGEINELKSFSPPVPEAPQELTKKKSVADGVVSKSAEKNIRQTRSTAAVYVNLPAEKKQTVTASPRAITDVALLPSFESDPAFNFSELNKKKHSRPAKVSGKIIWVSTILFLFGAGILTGLFISDRGKKFTTDKTAKEISPMLMGQPIEEHKKATGSIQVSTAILSADRDTVKTVFSEEKFTSRLKKQSKKDERRDSVKTTSSPAGTIVYTDSTIRQNAVSSNEILYQKVKTHPEHFLDLVTGHFNTGFLGGISSFPVSLTNNATIKLDQVIVTIQYIQNNDKVFKTENLSFTDIEPGETVSLKAPKSARGTKIATQLHVVSSGSSDFGQRN